MNSKQSPELERLTTEAVNPRSAHLDSMSAIEIVELINREDATIAAAIAKVAKPIALAIEMITKKMRGGGRLIYIGAGTSGRLGVLDASECPPTFRTDPEQVIGLIAGGYQALTRSIEGAEDFPEKADEDLKSIELCKKDVLCGIATSGRTPYVIGGLRFAKTVGASRIGIACNDANQLSPHAEIMISPIVGPEIISGSTRMKAGTATKMILNMLTTGTMVQLGKTFGNLMVDLRATNSQLENRAIRIVETLTELNPNECKSLLDQCNGEVKTAIVMHFENTDAESAREILNSVDGKLRKVLKEVD